MLNRFDDCSRLFVGSQIYERELLLAYLDFLPQAFRHYGLPLELYVDYHSLFFTAQPEALTQLGWALHFYGVSLRYAPTPQAKGKIEREHHFWQQRRPAFFASENISDLHPANTHIQALRLHRNQHEIQREFKMTPRQAWDRAQADQRSALRPVPACPLWPFVWSQRSLVKVGFDHQIPIGAQRYCVDATPGTRLVLCHHPSGHHSVLAAQPKKEAKPLVLFSNLPKPNVSF